MTEEEKRLYTLARNAENNRDYEHALTYYLKMPNNLEAIEKVGEYYYFGRGCEKDIEKARKYFKLAGDKGNNDAICNLALCTEDITEKVRLYRCAALQGSSYAMNMVGILIEKYRIEDCGTPYEWYEKAAKAGNLCGMYNLAMHTPDCMTALKLLKTAADKGHKASEKLYSRIKELGILSEVIEENERNK